MGRVVVLGMTVDKRVEPVVDVVIGVEVVGRHVVVVAKQVAADVVVGRKAVKAATMPRRDQPSRPARPSRCIWTGGPCSGKSIAATTNGKMLIQIGRGSSMKRWLRVCRRSASGPWTTTIRLCGSRSTFPSPRGSRLQKTDPPMPKPKRGNCELFSSRTQGW